jgi:predicted nucleic acid-binding Zn ribbon protein
VLIMGKEFPETPAGYRAAADHVGSLGSAFEEDFYFLSNEARVMEREQRFWFRMRVLVVTALILAGLIVWNPFY